MLLYSGISSEFPESSVWESDWEESEQDEEANEEEKKKRRRIKRRKAAATPSLIFGDNCHSCKRETTEQSQYVKCSRCPLRFCGICLLRKHGENVEEEMEENVRWVCPICRGGCGPGCGMNCCPCGPCRKYQQLEPAGRILPAAVRAGCNNVHDYLVHFETGEPPEVIARRKDGRGWTKATGAIDKSVDSNPTWAMKRMRSARRRMAPARLDSKWGFKQSCKSTESEESITDLMISKDTEILKRIRRPSIRLNSY